MFEEDSKCFSDKDQLNKQRPIPAFTSAEVASKFRNKSEERYVNEHMEIELISYKEEIERRFMNS